MKNIVYNTFYMQGEPEKSKGTNIIAIMPGIHWGTKSDEIVVVGAHWDSVDDSPGKLPNQILSPFLT